MNRRGFLSAILAAGMAPAIVKAANLMPVRPLLPGGSILGIDYAKGPDRTGIVTSEGGILRLFSGTPGSPGPMLAEVVMGALGGSAVMKQTGTVGFVRFDHPVMGNDIPIDLTLSTNNLCDGSILSIHPLTFHAK